MQLLPDPPDLGPGGAIAQLGERLVCNQKVAGSIPAGSTTLPQPPAKPSAMKRARLYGRSRLIARQHCRVFFKNLDCFVFDANFSSEDLLIKFLKLENVAFAM